jgi:hypothetical protein
MIVGLLTSFLRRVPVYPAISERWCSNGRRAGAESAGEDLVAAGGASHA